jgi:mono/diheme cytochrome c family protein
VIEMTLRIFLLMICLLMPAGCARVKVSNISTATEDSTLVAERISPSVLSPALTYEQRQGKNLYLKYCAVCHGAQGGADGFNTYNLDPKPHDLTDSAYVAALSDGALTQVIELGGRGVNKSVLMPAYGWTVNEDQISYLVSYVRVLARNVPVR